MISQIHPNFLPITINLKTNKLTFYSNELINCDVSFISCKEILVKTGSIKIFLDSKEEVSGPDKLVDKYTFFNHKRL